MHAVEEKIKWLQVNEPVLPNIPMTNLTPDVPKECLKYVLKIFLQAINLPHRFQADGTPDAVASYRHYYIFVKRYFAKWKKGNAPAWFSDGVGALDGAELAASDSKIADVRAGMKRKAASIKAAKEKKAKEKDTKGAADKKDAKNKKQKKTAASK